MPEESAQGVQDMKIARGLHAVFLVAAFALAAVALNAATAERAAGAAMPLTEQPLYIFCAQTSCADGAFPDAGLVMDAAGNLYGTTFGGGTGNNGGTVFELMPNGTETVLYSFCAQSSCADGTGPNDGLLMDAASGTLYGTTTRGGSNNDGTIFALTPNQARTAWTHTILYSFCANPQTLCSDGAIPDGGVIRDGAGNFYGTTQAGGVPNDRGVVFMLTPGGTENVLYSFGAYSTDGVNPVAGLIMDGSGNLYGTTYQGGNASNGGMVFKLTPSAQLPWTETALYTFCSQTNCTDGGFSEAGLIRDAAGNLYGTTVTGGVAGGCNGPGCGTAFMLTPGGTHTVLYTFCSQSNCTDGALPYGGLLMDGAGNLYGTTKSGGNGAGGVVFELTPNQGQTPWTENVLYRFCPQAACPDGSAPVAGVIMDAAGNLYSTTEMGGNATSSGTVFKLTQVNFTLTVSETSGGLVTSSPAGISCSNGGACSANFASGTLVTLSQAAIGGWNFLEWDNACTGNGVCKVTMTANQNVAATFWTTGGGGGSSVAASIQSVPQSFAAAPQAGATVGGAGALHGTTTSGGGAASQQAAAAASTATLSVSTFGSGTVTSSPAGISCGGGGPCSANFASGTDVSLSAAPSANWSFLSWGNACGGNGACTVTMGANQNVAATFGTAGGN